MELRAIKTFYTARDGLVTLDDDVLSIVRQVRERYGDRVKISLEQTTGEYVFSELGEDNTERLIFTTPELDGRALERLLQADSYSRTYEDPYEAAEREQDKLQDEIEARSREKLAEAGERLSHAFRKDGIDDVYPLAVTPGRDLNG